MVKAPAIGIDLGTSYSSVAVWRQGKVEIITNDQGNTRTPSYVAFTATERHLGDAAKQRMAFNPSNTIFDVKRLIGRKFDDPEVQKLVGKHWPFEMVDVSGRIKFEIKRKGEIKVVAPEEITSMVLTKIKDTAETYLGTTVRDAVISVPAHFGDVQRRATKAAAEIAGLNVLRIINEPTAAALAYGVERGLKGERNVLIFDLGGGCLDVSIITVTEGSLFQVRATASNSHLGGEDFDHRIVSYLIKKFEQEFGTRVRDNKKAMRQLKAAAEEAKRNLSISPKAVIEIDELLEGTDFYMKLTREIFDDVNSDLFRQCSVTLEKVLKEAKMQKKAIHDIVLVGGSTRIPKIRQLLQNFFYQQPITSAFNPEEAVAYGAAVQAAILTGEIDREIKLVDIAFYPLGIERIGGIMARIIDRKTPIPCKKSQTFTTNADNQPAVTIQVFEGGKGLVCDSNVLGQFDFIGIPQLPRTIPKIVVTFELDANGILNLSAHETSSGKAEKLQSRSFRGGLTELDMERILLEAKKYQEDDRRRRENVAAKNSLEAYIYEVKEHVTLVKNKFSSEVREKIQQECNACLEWLDSNTSNEEKVYEDKHLEVCLKCAHIMSQTDNGHIRTSPEIGGSFGELTINGDPTVGMH